MATPELALAPIPEKELVAGPEEALAPAPEEGLCTLMEEGRASTSLMEAAGELALGDALIREGRGAERAGEAAGA